MMLRQLSVQALALLASGATAASAGVLIVGTYTGTQAQTPKGRTVEFRIQDGRGKITGQPGQAIYYDHATRTASIVDTVKGTAFEMNEARAKQMGNQLADAQRMMEAKLKELPPERRAQFEKMIKDQGGMPAARSQTPLKFAKTGSGKIGTWACDRYAASGDGRTVEVCTAEASSIGLSAADLAVFEGFLDLSENMTGGRGGFGAGPDRGFSGVPLERVESRDGKVTDRFTIETIRPETIPAADLKVPPGLKPPVQPKL